MAAQPRRELHPRPGEAVVGGRGGRETRGGIGMKRKIVLATVLCLARNRLGAVAAGLALERARNTTTV